MSRAHLACVLLGAVGVGCAAPNYYAKRPCDRPDLAGCTVREVDVSGAKEVPAGDLKEKIVTAETNHTLGGVLENVPILSLWDRINVDYETYDPLVLERDMARVERIYKARGHYEARARVARVRKVGPERVKVEIVVDEGPVVTVARVDVTPSSVADTPEKVRKAAKSAGMGLEKGKPFVEATFEESKSKIRRALTNLGYAYATVSAKATVDLSRHTVNVNYEYEPGPPCVFGEITLDGYGDLPATRLREMIAIQKGQRFSTARIESAQLALSELRVFGSVDAVPALDDEIKAHPQQAAGHTVEVPVAFRVTPTSLKTVKIGWGGELGTRVATKGLAGWENRNFFGGLRSFTIEAKPAGVIYPFTLGSLFQSPPTDVKLVPELRVHTALVQPGFIESRTRGLINLDLNAYQLQPTDTLGYLEFAGKLGMERAFWNSRIHVGGYFNAQVDQPLKLQLPGMEIIPQSDYGYHRLAVPSLQAAFALDLRRNAEGKRDPVNPHSGFYFSNDLQLAYGPADWSSQDVRFRVEARGYIPISKKVTLALRLGGGILHAFGGGLADTPTAPEVAQQTTTRDPANPKYANDYQNMCRPQNATGTRSRWIQLLQLRGFNSGGTNSNRGYAYSAVGPQEIVPGISPMTSEVVNVGDGLQRICTPLPTATGGMAMWEASIELRFPVYGSFGMTLFLDGSDVRQVAADFGAPFAPHLTAGVGIHIATPVGPIRADFGVRIPGAQVIGSSCPVYDAGKAPAVSGANTCDPAAHRDVAGGFLDPKYGQAGSLWGIPLALSLAIGEAF